MFGRGGTLAAGLEWVPGTGWPSSGSIKTGRDTTGDVTLGDGGRVATPPSKADGVVTLEDGWGMMAGLLVRR